jgi:integrase
MPTLKRKKTNYIGVFYIDGTSPATGKPEKIFYIRYRKAGKMIEEKAGRQSTDDMTPARAARIRAERIDGKTPSRKEARKQLEAEKKEEADRWTFNRLWQEYKDRKPDHKGVVTDENRYQNHLKPLFGDREPQSITPLDVDRLRLKLLKTRKPGTVKNVLELLRRLVNFAAKKHLSPPPSFIIEMPKVNNLKTEDLTPGQLASLLEAIEQDPNIQAGNFMKLAMVTGMRRGEIFRLQWGDLDWERNFIHLRNAKSGQDEKIPLNQAARELLESHPRTGSPFVFPGRGGVQRVDISHQVNRIKKAAGLPKDFRALHGLRHFFASTLASSGVDLLVLMKLLTHRSATMVLRYAHLRDDALRKASDLASDLIGQAVNGKQRKIANLKE